MNTVPSILLILIPIGINSAYFLLRFMSSDTVVLISDHRVSCNLIPLSFDYPSTIPSPFSNHAFRGRKIHGSSDH